MQIRVENIYKRFGKTEVLKGISLNIQEGKIVMIIGGSGTGKSVLLKNICGLLKPEKGKIFIGNDEITGLSERKLFDIRRKMGVIFQSGGLLASLSVGENVSLGLREHKLFPKDKIKDIIREKLALVELEGKEDVMPANLSGGMKKRVSIARALTMNPEIILYDEPTAGLDPPMSENIDNLIKDLNSKMNVTSIVITHDLISIFNIAHYVYMLHKGEIIFSGTPDELRSSKDPIVAEFISRK